MLSSCDLCLFLLSNFRMKPRNAPKLLRTSSDSKKQKGCTWKWTGGDVLFCFSYLYSRHIGQISLSSPLLSFLSYILKFHVCRFAFRIFSLSLFFYRDLAVDLRLKLGDWFRVVQLLKTGGGGGKSINFFFHLSNRAC